ncbi:polysaccharide export protein [Mucilaginibacter sp. RS28]|uniref:Polysaccharide export protein n=1 Tax=Mucilaginibacter straminoryzae TaxID=2932774 RepID=A0A9X2BBV2_9SPHI|nr:polysaccharide biosynthesis/export family protein [Mucilaginibacter straminoryzae]MCJ8210242.1 polysaccharide export protein [Mucilaginibacter straminoryzae]
MSTKKKESFFSLIVLLGVMILSSCFNEKKITYFQRSGSKDTVAIAREYVPKIQPGDLLSIYVNSLSPEASSFFNPYSSSRETPDATPSLSQSAAPGYLVDGSGNITLPLVGSVAVGSLTTNEATGIIRKKLEFYLKEPTVTVRFLNFRISILGEVSKPGIYVIPNERITLPEAITLAGDLTPFAKQNSIEIIRDVNNKKEFGEVDFTKSDVFSSPYYYLHSNDIVYVKASKGKIAQTDLALRLIPIMVSIITVGVLIFRK